MMRTSRPIPEHIWIAEFCASNLWQLKHVCTLEDAPNNSCYGMVIILFRVSYLALAIAAFENLGAEI